MVMKRATVVENALACVHTCKYICNICYSLSLGVSLNKEKGEGFFSELCLTIKAPRLERKEIIPRLLCGRLLHAAVFR